MKHTQQSGISSAIDRFAHRLVARLDDGLNALPYDVVERLRASRVQALQKRKRPVTVAVGSTSSAWSRAGSALTLGGGGGTSGWWMMLASGIPVLALVAGIMFMGAAQEESGTNEVAEVDAALLADDLPPAAYADPGFVQFLKTRAAERN